MDEGNLSIREIKHLAQIQDSINRLNEHNFLGNWIYFYKCLGINSLVIIVYEEEKARW